MLNEFFREKKTAFIPFIVTGAPTLDFTEKTIDVLVTEGADLIELGMPFSDASADGPVIQQASEWAATKNGSLQDVLNFARKIRIKYPKLGLILFTYYNPLLKMGLESFASKAKAAGINAVLSVDLPVGEAQEYLKIFKEVGLGTVFLISPTTDPKRFTRISDASTEFVYYVSRVGVTGAQNEITETLIAELVSLRKVISKPIVVGFGISTGRQAKEIAPYADGVVVGSAFVKIMMENGRDEERLGRIANLASEIKMGIKK
jgi:tryptophan synthase alpha chain